MKRKLVWNICPPLHNPHLFIFFFLCVGEGGGGEGGKYFS